MHHLHTYICIYVHIYCELWSHCPLLYYHQHHNHHWHYDYWLYSKEKEKRKRIFSFQTIILWTSLGVAVSLQAGAQTTDDGMRENNDDKRKQQLTFRLKDLTIELFCGLFLWIFLFWFWNAFKLETTTHVLVPNG